MLPSGNAPARNSAIPFSSSKASVYLDAIRALAAIEVMLSHWRPMLYAGMHEVPAHHAVVSLLYTLTGGGTPRSSYFLCSQASSLAARF